MTYDNGDLEITSPLPEHEDAKTAIGDFVKAILEELNVPRRGLGSTTFRKKLKKKGFEPDDCFYIKSQPLVRLKPFFLEDRKSTRLNSSHQIISYAVFCLTKKKKIKRQH